MSLDYFVTTKDSNGDPEFVGQVYGDDEALEIIGSHYLTRDASQRVGTVAFEKKIRAAFEQARALERKRRICDAAVKVSATFGGCTIWISVR